MIIRKVNLVNFRSHVQLSVVCNTQTTTIMGRNGCGKTSILEAIYEVLQGKSFKAVDREILQRGAEFYRIELEFCDGVRSVATYDANRDVKEFLIEDKKARRLPKKNKYPVILFEPDDLHLVGSSPTNKRGYFDRVFSQFSAQYAVALSKYNKALKQRNELLKNDEVEVSDLFAWNVMLAKYGTTIATERRKIIEQINQKMTDVYRSIAENSDEVGLDYDSKVSTETKFLEALERNFQRDSLLGHTTYGIHHDNYNFIFNNVTADGSASRGEIRSSVLALKFIEAEMVTEKLGKKPVVLLDDVFSELDEKRQKCLVRNFKENQVILTSVSASELTIS